jgi:hypothetical protein
MSDSRNEYRILSFKQKLLKKIKRIIELYNLDPNNKEYTNKVIIDGIVGISLYNNVSLFRSKPRNILFLEDYHVFDNTFKESDLYSSLMEIYEEINQYVIKTVTNNKMKYIRDLINFLNENLYSKISKDLYKKEIISINQLLYYIAINNNECLDIFIENYPINLENNIEFYNFLYLNDRLFFNCGDKILFNNKEGKIVNDTSISSKMCNFNIRYHRSDLRNNLYSLEDVYYIYNDDENIDTDMDMDIEMDVDLDNFPGILNEYLIYLFDTDSSIDINSTQFFDIHLKNYKNSTYYKELIDYYVISKELILKQYNKSIFSLVDNLDIKKLIIEVDNLDERISREDELWNEHVIYNDIFNIKLTCLTMNLYSIFRMFINEWHNKPKINLNETCSKLDYPKNIIYSAGGLHNNWIINFIKTCSDNYQYYDINHDVDRYQYVDISQHIDIYINTYDIDINLYNNIDNYITLDNLGYNALKKFILNINVKELKNKKIIELYSDKAIDIIENYIKEDVFKYIDIRTLILDLITINNKLNNVSNLDIVSSLEYKDKLLVYIIDINDIYNKLKDIDIKNNMLYIKDLFDNDNDTNIKDIDIYIDYIKLYCELLIKNIDNMIIVINYYLNNTSDEIDDIYYIDPKILNYKGLLKLYNKNTNLSIYLPNKQRIS